MQRPAIVAGCYFAVRITCLTQGQVFSERDDTSELWIVAFQSAEIHFGQLDRLHLPGTNQLRELRDRPERHVLEVLEARHVTWLAGAKWMSCAIDLHPRHDWIEVKRWRDFIVQGDLVQRLVSRQILVDAFEHGVELGLRK